LLLGAVAILSTIKGMAPAESSFVRLYLNRNQERAGIADHF